MARLPSALLALLITLCRFRSGRLPPPPSP
jgi:hypothetical protein